MNFKLPKTHVQSFLGIFSDITKDFKSQLLENYSTNFIWNTCTCLDENNWRLSACFIRYFFIHIIVCTIVWRTEISMKYSDAANTFLVGGMNFNRVCKEVSRDIPFILVSETVVWCEGEPASSSMYELPFADKYTLSFSLFMSLLTLRFVSLRLCFLAV